MFISATLLLSATLHAQPPSLALPRVTAVAGGKVALELSYASVAESPVAALQWTFEFPADAITGITVEDAPATGAAGKTVICGGDSSGYKCLAVGANADSIGDGVVARVIFSLAPGATEATILVADTLGVSPDGQPVTVRGENGKISVAEATIRHGIPARSRRVVANK